MDKIDLFSDFDTTENAEKGVRMELVDPRTEHVIMCQGENDSEPKANYLILKGTDSADTRRAFMQLQSRDDGKIKRTISNDEFEAEVRSGCKALAKLTVGGEVYGKAEGSEKYEWVQMSPDNAYSLYIRASVFRDQAMAFIIKKGNFLGD